MPERALKTPPVAEPVSLDEAKAHLRLDTSTENSLVQMLIQVAREHAEALLGRPILSRVYRQHLEKFPNDLDPIPLSEDVSAVESLVYRAPTGAFLTLPDTDFAILGANRLSAPNGWPAGTAITLDYKAGMFETPEAVPASIKQWVLMRVATLFENREALTDGRLKELPRTFVDGMLDQWRIFRV